MSVRDEIDELYDWAEVDRRLSPPRRVRGRRGAGAAVLAAALYAIEDVFLDEKAREPIVEEVEVPGLDWSQRVVVHLVPDDPSASRAFVR